MIWVFIRSYFRQKDNVITTTTSTTTKFDTTNTSTSTVDSDTNKNNIINNFCNMVTTTSSKNFRLTKIRTLDSFPASPTC